MIKKIILTGLLCVAFQNTTHAQEEVIVETKASFEERITQISTEIKKIKDEEKTALKNEIEAINNQIKEGKLSTVEAEKEKSRVAELHASNIDTRIEEKTKELELLVREEANEVQDTTKGKYSLSIPGGIKNRENTNKNEKRTTGQFVFATGFNNLVTNRAIANSNFSYLRSTFYELGYTFNTRLTTNSNLLHLKYGLGFQYNMLHATEDRIFADLGEQTALINNPYGANLKDNCTYFKNVYLVAPVHLEFDFSKTETVDDKKIFRSHKSVRVGLGGYVGYNTNTKQFVKYELNDSKISEKTKADFNVNDWNYGLSAYIGHKETSLYVKYDLNPLFKNNSIEQNNISLGIRFDIN